MTIFGSARGGPRASHNDRGDELTGRGVTSSMSAKHAHVMIMSLSFDLRFSLTKYTDTGLL
ncbi:hypothetical protein BCAR13_10165 [Paraburkholderia caribensis]|nr:hypothetical protein BCAR13_10165 [Paraburkholderia caribensis]